MEKIIYRPIIKDFLGESVRVVQVGLKEYVILKDIFSALGRVKADGTWTDEKKKLILFLKDIDKISDHETFEVTSKSKNKRSRETQDVDCLNIETLPIVLTQFRPTARKGKEALDKWCKFMKWVNKLLIEHEAYKMIVKDKEHQKDLQRMFSEDGGKAVVMNNQICGIMAELVGVYPDIKKLTKEDLKIYQNQTTIDLLEVRQWCLEKYEEYFVITNSNAKARETCIKMARRKYNL